jgi:hypothetical protein
MERTQDTDENHSKITPQKRMIRLKIVKLDEASSLETVKGRHGVVHSWKDV